jgi:hypothetical protein
MTDASDYGIRDNLYQVITNTKHVVTLVSKSLTQTNLATEGSYVHTNRYIRTTRYQ